MPTLWGYLKAKEFQFFLNVFLMFMIDTFIYTKSISLRLYDNMPLFRPILTFISYYVVTCICMRHAFHLKSALFSIVCITCFAYCTICTLYMNIRNKDVKFIIVYR